MGSRLCPCVFPYLPDKICQCVFPYIISPLVSIIFVPISHVSNSFPCMFHNVFPYVPIFSHMCPMFFNIFIMFSPVFAYVSQVSHMFPQLRCRRSPCQDNNELWSTFASGVDGRLRIEKSTTSLAGWVATKNEMVNIPDVAQVECASRLYPVIVVYEPDIG